MEIAVSIIIGFILDCIFGDPQNAPHPVRFMGDFIIYYQKKSEKIFNRSKIIDLLIGLLLVIILLSISFFIPYFILKIVGFFNRNLKVFLEAFFCYKIFATKSLKTESLIVYNYLIKNDLENSRKYLSWIVGRDTENLNEDEIICATVETISENTCDGVIAPLIFMIIGGAPLGFLYKAINTMDSMIGYKNDKYYYFGKVAAKLDDVVNFFPAIFSAYIMLFSSFLMGLDYGNGYYIYKRDKKNHNSPNSAKTESVCAGVLNIQLAGNSYYNGILVKKPFIGDDNRPITVHDIIITNQLMYCATVVTVFFGILLRIGVFLI